MVWVTDWQITVIFAAVNQLLNDYISSK